MNQEEYIKLFISESVEMCTSLEESLMRLEKEPDNVKTLNELFRITHTLKGNSIGMGYDDIATMAHLLEDFFSELKSGTPLLDKETFELLFRSKDTISQMVDAIETGKEVSFRGLRQKLRIILSQAQKDDENPPISRLEESQTGAELKLEEPKEEQNHKESQRQNKDETSTHQQAISDYIQVPTEKLDSLLDLIGELVIERDRLIAQNQGSHLVHSYNRLSRISSDLQYGVMNIRLMQVGFLFKKFHRLVRDTAAQEGKQVQLVLKGVDVEVDRNILKVMSDSLVHLIRNAIGHGIESTDERQAANKRPEGKLLLEAVTENHGVRISISDDGKGINVQKIREQAIAKGLVTKEVAKDLTMQQIISYIFEPGFSTSQAVSDVSGRGVGMDVVKTALDQVGGQIEVETRENEGTTFHLFMPASMAVKSVMLFELKKQVYAIQLAYTDFVSSVYKSHINSIKNNLVFQSQGQTIPLYSLAQLFCAKEPDFAEWNAMHPEEVFQVIVVHIRGRRIGLIVDKMLQQKEIVEKPLSKPINNNEFINGTTILGDSRICLVINIPALFNSISKRKLNIQHL